MSEKRWGRRIAAVVGVVTAVVLVAAAVVPFLIPIPELKGLVPDRDLAGTDSRFVTVPFDGTDGVDLHYVDSMPANGAAEEHDPRRVFVLLHGSMFTLRTWDEIAADLAFYGRVIAYDQLPYGLSEKMQEGEWQGGSPYTQEAAVAQLVGLLDALGLDRVTLVGHSYGGTLATRTAIEYSERVEALILLDPAVYVAESMPSWLMRLPQVRRLGPLLARSFATSESFFKKCYADPDAWTSSKAATSTIHTQTEGWDSAMWSYLSGWSSATEAFISQISAIAVPTLVISGSEDAIIPLEQSRRVVEEISGATMAVIDGAGHMPHEEAPGRVMDIIAGWLSE